MRIPSHDRSSAALIRNTSGFDFRKGQAQHCLRLWAILFSAARIWQIVQVGGMNGEPMGPQSVGAGSEAGTAAAIALGVGAAESDAANAFLKEQTTLARLQIKDLEHELNLHHWSMLLRHVSDVMKVTFEIAAALIAVFLLSLVGYTIWSAAHDDSVVVEAFKVPPDLAQRGLSGDVIASAVLDRLTDLQARTDSSRAPSTYLSDWGRDIKVQIPNTGISISEAYRWLAERFGNQTHISGEVFRTSKGISLTVRVSGSAGVRFDGSEQSIDDLVTLAARAVYRETQPYRYAISLIDNSSASGELESVLTQLALNGPQADMPWAYTVLAIRAMRERNPVAALDRARKAAELAPQLPPALLNLAQIEAEVGHDELELGAAHGALKALDGDGVNLITPRAAKIFRWELIAVADEEGGAFRDAATRYEHLEDMPDYETTLWQARSENAAYLALAHDVAASRRVLGSLRDAALFKQLADSAFGWNLANFRLAEFQQFVALDDWRDARKDLDQALPGGVPPPTIYPLYLVQILPWLALAEAKTGDPTAARIHVARFPSNCYLCMRVRGSIGATSGDLRGAAYWFGSAIAQSPTIPFAYSEWGEVLMHSGQYNAAIEKFREANLKGPHFADPLEMWGEALMQQNRSDLALAKFDEANKYAPNWGRLHLEWGKALWWSGKRDSARTQFALAAKLDLSPADRDALTRIASWH